MKSVVIYQNGVKIIHLQKKPYGVESDIINGIGDVEILIIGDDNKRIKIINKK
jgi:hypothetical protein